jgi:hypothetical protein
MLCVKTALLCFLIYKSYARSACTFKLIASLMH